MGLMAGYMSATRRLRRPKPDSEPDSWGNQPTDDFTLKARITEGQRFVRTATGEQKPSIALIETEFKVHAGDLIELQPGSEVWLSILRWDSVNGLSGAVDHYEVYL
jgi:hypothetical protein